MSNILNIIPGISIDDLIENADIKPAERGDYSIRDVLTSYNFTESLSVESIHYKLFCFKCGIHTNQAITLILTAGWQPAKIEHLLYFGVQFSKKLFPFPVVALGSSHDGKYFGFVDEYDIDREGDVRILDSSEQAATIWSQFCHFLAVKPVKN